MRLSVRVTPRASKLAVEGFRGDVLIVKLTRPASDGEANEQLIELLAKQFRIAKSSITIVSGQTNREKVLEVPESVSELLQSWKDAAPPNRH